MPPALPEVSDFAGMVGSSAQAGDSVAVDYQFISIGGDVIHLFEGHPRIAQSIPRKGLPKPTRW
jgi:hypothetical protein